MNFIAWNSGMSVGRSDLDGHHQMIIDCLNRLNPMIGVAGQEEDLLKVLDTLEDFVLVHFSEEERLMKRAGYPDWLSHKAQHDLMYEMVFKIKAEVAHGRFPDARRLYETLYDWLMTHILGEDRNYIPYLKNPVQAADPAWSRSNGRPF